MLEPFVACMSFRDTRAVTKTELFGLTGGALGNLVLLFLTLNLFLGAFAKLRKTNISFVMSLRPSDHTHGINRLPPDGFS